MYTPPINHWDDENEIISFMQEYSFATIISFKDNQPIASHLPLVIEKENDEIVIYGHWAIANPQWKNITDQKVLIIFSEPHAYISPSHYEHKVNVPTWNYMAVHVYGSCTLITEEQDVRSVLEKSIHSFEKEYFTTWQSLPADYIEKMMKGIVCFKLLITEIQAKKKLSQNKTAIEKENITNALMKSKDTNEQVIGEWMSKDK